MRFASCAIAVLTSLVNTRTIHTQVCGISVIGPLCALRPSWRFWRFLCSPGAGIFSRATTTPTKKNWAVIVGISNYQSSALNLKWAEEDALDFYDALRSSKSWETDNITLLTNGSATRDGIKAALAGLAKRVSADDQVVFYFSGRGSYGPDQPPFDEGDGLDEYLVPYDGLTTSPARDLSDDAIEALLSALPTNNVLVILDAGFTGASSRSGIPSEKEKCVLRAGNGKTVAPQSVDGMSHELARPGYIFISAAQNGTAPGESSQLRNGVFTHYFVEGLRGAANPGRKTTRPSRHSSTPPPAHPRTRPASRRNSSTNGEKLALSAR